LTTAEAAGSTTSNNCTSRTRRSRGGGNIHITQYTGQSSKAIEVQWEFQKSSQIHHSMQAVCTDEDEKNTSRRTNTVGTIIYIEGISRCLEVKHAGGLGGRITGI